MEDVVIFYARLLITQQKQQEAFQILDKYHKQISNPVSVADLYKSAYLLDKNETARGNCSYYLIDLESISQEDRSFRTYLVVLKVQSGECLQQVMKTKLHCRCRFLILLY